MPEHVVLITGATNGLGAYLTRELVASGTTVVAHGRDAGKLERLRSELGVRTVRADLGELRQVDRMADEVLDSLGLDRLDVLVNNAGIGFGPPGAERQLSADGYELRFAVNYLAGYHLTRRLLPLVRARIVNVSSLGQVPLDFDDPMFERGYNGTDAYRRSKLAQIMFTIDLAEELADAGVTVNSLHPATFMDTQMVAEFGGQPMSTVEEGGAATLRLITDPALDGVTGRFFDGFREAPAKPQAYDPAARRRLRQLSDELVSGALN
jgi:NAD(P)-dependent dehydrogenase (short-subunit alcohol dehydrogenase family)